MNLMAFDIATVPDPECGRRLYGLQDLDDADVVRVMQHRSRQRTGQAHPVPAHQRRLAALTLVRRHGDGLDVETLVASRHEDRTLIEAFFHQIERSMPALVSWDGRAPQLSVLQYRALAHGVSSPRYWSWADGAIGAQGRPADPPVYLGQVLGSHAGAQVAPLAEVGVMLGLPAAAPPGPSETSDLWLAGDVAAISKACDFGALTTYIVYLRLELARGRLSAQRHGEELLRLRDRLSRSEHAHLAALAAALPQT
jgi:hypothetical protein